MSSDDEIISTDEMDSMYDTADDGDLSEEYALTFELPGKLIYEKELIPLHLVSWEVTLSMI